MNVYYNVKKKLPINDFLYVLFIVFYIFQILFHILFSVLLIVLGIVEFIINIIIYFILPSDIKLSGCILKKGDTQIGFSLFFFVYQLVFICLIVCIFLECLEK